MRKMFKNKINETNRALSQMRAGQGLQQIDIFSAERNSAQQNNYDDKVRSMFAKISQVKIDPDTKVLKQYDKVLQCLEHKDTIYKRKNLSEVKLDPLAKQKVSAELGHKLDRHINESRISNEPSLNGRSPAHSSMMCYTNNAKLEPIESVFSDEPHPR